VVLDDAALTYTGSGSSLIAEHGESGTLSGNLSAGQSLVLQSTCAEHVRVSLAASFANAGSITLTNGDGCGDNATLVQSSGTLSNSGTITSEPAVGGLRTLQGNITNTGKLVINKNTVYSGAGTILNEGAITIASGVSLSAAEAPMISNEAGGLITGTGTGTLFQRGGTFTEGAGATAGSTPVIVDDGALHYTGAGAGTIALRGEGSVSGTISAGQVLSIQSSCTEHARTTAAGSFSSSGTIDLTNGDGCGNNATLVLGAKKTLTNKETGTINAERPAGGARTIEGDVKNEGLVSISAGQTLKLTGTFTQTAKGTFKTAIASSSSFGAMAVTGAAKLAGALAVVEVESFVGTAGETFAILSGAPRTGTFSDLDGVVTSDPSRYYRPTYSGTGVALIDTVATLTATPTEGAAGSKVTLKGTGFFPADKIKATFLDGKAKTSFTTVTASGTGEFSVEVTLSSKDAKGVGTFSAPSGTVTGLVATTPFTVT
jgi:hypothetical protein